MACPLKYTFRPRSPHARKICCTSLSRWAFSFGDDDTDTCFCSRDEVSLLPWSMLHHLPLILIVFPTPIPPRAFRLPSLLLPPYLMVFPSLSLLPVPSYRLRFSSLSSPLFFCPPATLHSLKPLLLARPLPLFPLDPHLLYPIPLFLPSSSHSRVLLYPSLLLLPSPSFLLLFPFFKLPPTFILIQRCGVRHFLDSGRYRGSCCRR